MTSFDVVVAGLGAMGSAAAFELARRGASVLGLDRFAPPHASGSSHGRARIIREAYFEDPLYVPLVRRAYERWAELERLAGRTLLVPTGGLMLGPPDGVVVAGALRSAREHGLPHELLDAREVHHRVPGLRVTSDMVGVWEPRAGFLVPEAVIAAHLALAADHGAELRVEEPVRTWDAAGDGVVVTTARGTYRARRLVLAAGAWMSSLLGAASPPLVVERMVQHWFRPARDTGLYAPSRFPIFLCEYAPGRTWYGFPDVGDGVKVALHHQGEPADADTLRRTVAPAEIAYVHALLRTFLPDADGAHAESAVCMYTNTPDEHFVVDRHPAWPQVIVASACSGHGFKFSSAIGEILADMALGERPTFDLAPFRISRFAHGVVAHEGTRHRRSDA
ncbi:FAD dependent oxidoreductase (plasmid) [Gemmatirosa kalamazoonensis]|uniref:FAD dependent oxidoreductase n=1 Tax=Gemmatirosa kalamazoonensis TaxID=861299 RepID=W0RSR1_9BACT|nr:N-methyl-L-tryptophan oxidase [Gemmatirosa kalamazoonensis]AHG93512.1 FAD dependent oxidoreductase [Gemmatirosa kalamazoonensis]